MFKVILSTILSMSLLLTASMAQRLVISEDVLTYKKEERASVQVFMEPEPKVVKKAFEDWMKDKYNVNLKGIGFLANKDVLSAERVSIPEVSGKEMDFYAKVIEKNDNTEMSVFASYGYEIHISPEKYPTEFRAIKGIVQTFLNDWLPVYYNNQVSMTSEQLSDLRNDQSRLEETIADNKREMEKLAQENEKLARKLNKNERDLEELSQTLNTKKDKLESINKMLKDIK